MTKNKKEKLVEKPQNGFRKGIKKEDVLELSDEEKKWLRLKREHDELFVENVDAQKCAARNDQMYQQFNQTLSDTETLLYNVLNAKRTIDNNNKQILSGSTERRFPDTQIKMDVEDLKIENIRAWKIVNDNIRQLWTYLADLFRYVDVSRIDKVKFFSKPDYEAVVDKVKKSLNNLGLDLYDERYKAFVENQKI